MDDNLSEFSLLTFLSLNTSPMKQSIHQKFAVLVQLHSCHMHIANCNYCTSVVSNYTYTLQ